MFPKTCFGCGKEGKYVCNDCEVFLGEAAPAKIDYSVKHGLDGLVSMWEYEGIAKEALHRIKYWSNFDAIPELLKKAFQVMRRVPGPITSVNSEGINQLIKEGASIASKAEDILSECGFSSY